MARALASTATLMFIYDVGPGQRQSPYHYEYDEEWLLVVDGSLVLRTPDGEHALERGDHICFPAGPAGAHQLINRSNSPARTLMFSSSRVLLQLAQRGIRQGADESRRDEHADEYERGEDDEHASPSILETTNDDAALAAAWGGRAAGAGYVSARCLQTPSARVGADERHARDAGYPAGVGAVRPMPMLQVRRGCGQPCALDRADDCADIARDLLGRSAAHRDQREQRCRQQELRTNAAQRLAASRAYLISVSILNIGRYIEITIVPTMIPTPIISTGSMIEVSVWMAASTSSS